MWGFASVVIFVSGAVVGIWWPLTPWQLALASVGGGGLICLLFVAVYRP